MQHKEYWSTGGTQYEESTELQCQNNIKRDVAMGMCLVPTQRTIEVEVKRNASSQRSFNVNKNIGLGEVPTQEKIEVEVGRNASNHSKTDELWCFAALPIRRAEIKPATLFHAKVLSCRWLHCIAAQLLLSPWLHGAPTTSYETTCQWHFDVRQWTPVT